MTIGCKTLSKHLTDTYYRGSAGGAAINQNSCGRRRLLMEPWKADSIPCSSLFLQIKTQGNQERNPIWFGLPPRRGSGNLLVLGGGSRGWGWQVEKIWGYCLGWNFRGRDEEGRPEAGACYQRACGKHMDEPRGDTRARHVCAAHWWAPIQGFLSHLAVLWEPPLLVLVWGQGLWHTDSSSLVSTVVPSL